MLTRLRFFQQLRSYRDEPGKNSLFFSKLVPMGTLVPEEPQIVYHNAAHLYSAQVLVPEKPQTAFHNAAHLNSDQANLFGDPAEVGTCELTLGSQAS